MALLTAAEARVYLPALSGTAEDSTLDTLIARVGAAVARYLGYPPATVGANPTVESASYTLYSGPHLGGVEVSEDGRRLYLPVRPLTAIASIYDDPNEEYGAATLLGSSDYAIVGDDGEVRLKPLATWGGFSDVPFSVKIACTAGYTSVPAEINHAAGLTVAHVYARRAAAGGESIDASGTRIAFERVNLPTPAREVLDQLRSARGWAA